MLSNVENIIGSDYPDTLTGDANANNIRGGKGNDTVEGGDGGDTLWGEGGTGDTLTYASSDAAVTVNIAAKTASGGHAQGDTGLGGFENLIGSANDDTITGTSSANKIEGGAGDDTISGGGGNDVIEGGGGADTMTGGTGTDTLSYASSTSEDRVWVNIGTPKFSDGDAEGDSASGFENLIGSYTSDILVGDENDNVIIGFGGADEIDGGDGTDTVSYALLDDSVVFNFAGGGFGNKSDTGKDRVGGGGHAEGNVIVTTTNSDGDIIPTIENVIGSDYPDWFIIQAAGNEIDGGDSIDDGKSTIYFPKAEKPPAVTSAGISNRQEFYHGLGDVVDYRKSGSGVTVNLTTGTNTGGSAAGDTLTGIESIVGSFHADTLSGDENNNTFFGLGGGDAFDGKGGTDVVNYSWINPPTQRSGGFNALTDIAIVVDLKTPSNNTWEANGDTFTNIEWIVGSNFNDKITGNDDPNRLSGGFGEDILKGGGGDDLLYGVDELMLRRVGFKQWHDELYGGAGNDRIIVGSADEGRGEAGNDKFLAMGSGFYIGGAGTDEFYFHRNYFPAPAKTGGAGQIWDYQDNEDIRICMGSGKGTADGEVSWTLATEHIVGLPTSTHETVITVSLQYGTEAVNQGTILVVNFDDTSKIDIAWSDPNAAVGTGCNLFDLASVPGQTRMIRAGISKLITN